MWLHEDVNFSQYSVNQSITCVLLSAKLEPPRPNRFFCLQAISSPKNNLCGRNSDTSNWRLRRQSRLSRFDPEKAINSWAGEPVFGGIQNETKCSAVLGGSRFRDFPVCPGQRTHGNDRLGLHLCMRNSKRRARHLRRQLCR